MTLHRKLAGFLGFSVLAIAGPAQALPTVSPKNKPAAKSPKGPGNAPLPKAKPSPKVLPVPEQMQPINRTRPQLDPKLAKALRNPKALSKTRIAGIAGRFNIDVAPNDVEATTTLTVRRPYRGPGAYMSFDSPRDVHPQTPSDGLATLDSQAELRRVRGTGPTPVPSETPEMLAQQFDPLHPDFPAAAEATLDGSHLGLHLQAAANRDYVVSCRVRASESTADFGVRVEVNGSYSHMLAAIAPERGRISFALPRASRVRGIDLQLVAAVPITAQDGLGFGAAVAGRRRVTAFSVSRCDITPLS